MLTDSTPGLPLPSSTIVIDVESTPARERQPSASTPDRRASRLKWGTGANWLGAAGLPLYFGGMLYLALLFQRSAKVPRNLFSIDPEKPFNLVVWLLSLVLPLGIDFVRFLPFGILATLALPTRRRRSRRWAYVIVPGFAIGALFTYLIRDVEAGWRNPSALGLLLPLMSCFIGAWGAATWARSVRSRILFIPKALSVLLAGPVMLAVVMALSLQREPLAFEPVIVSPDARRDLVESFKGKNPKNLHPDRIVRLHLTGLQIDQLLSWGGDIVSSSSKARVDLTGAYPTVHASVPSPLLGDWLYLNVVAAGDISITDGEMLFLPRQLKVGRIRVPHWLLRMTAPSVQDVINHGPGTRPLVRAVKRLRIGPEGLTMTYGRAVLPSGLFAKVFHATDTGERQRQAVHAYLERLLASASQLDDPDLMVGRVLEIAFAHARDRSYGAADEQSAAFENRAAVVALGILMRHHRIETMVGHMMTPGDWKRARVLQQARLRERKDWTRHFFVSAALAAIGNEGLSDSAGALKENLDADGGSGFSFADLLADRTGTTFAARAMESEDAARAMQDRLAAGFVLDDFFPPAGDLPENLQDADFKRRFGGMDGPGYLKVAAEIERRISACAAYQRVAKTALSN